MKAAARALRRKRVVGRYTGDDVVKRWAEQGGRCAICGGGMIDYHVDHIIPISKGGTNWPDNIQLTHPVCNLRKNAKMPGGV